jgi:methyl-accepting chemotaxis protein
VVASEVRTLAQRSSQAAKDITTLIGDSTNHVNDGARLTEAAGNALNEIVEGINTVAKTIDDITAASREQSVGVDEISQTVSHLDSMTQENASLSDQSAATAQTLASEAQRLAEIVRVFRTDDSEPARIDVPRAPAAGPRLAAGTPPSGLAKSGKPAKNNGAGRAPSASATLRPATGSDWSEF